MYKEIDDCNIHPEYSSQYQGSQPATTNIILLTESRPPIPCPHFSLGVLCQDAKRASSLDTSSLSFKKMVHRKIGFRFPVAHYVAIIEYRGFVTDLVLLWRAWQKKKKKWSTDDITGLEIYNYLYPRACGQSLLVLPNAHIFTLASLFCKKYMQRASLEGFFPLNRKWIRAEVYPIPKVVYPTYLT